MLSFLLIWGSRSHTRGTVVAPAATLGVVWGSESEGSRGHSLTALMLRAQGTGDGVQACLTLPHVMIVPAAHVVEFRARLGAFPH